MTTVELNWDFIKAQLPADWRELAVEMGLIHPQPPQLHTKVHDIEPILRLELHRAGLEASLQTTTSTAAAANQADGSNGPLVQLAPTSLHAWERKLGPYLAALLSRMVGASDVFAPMQWSGYEIIVADGSVVTRPGAKGVTARLRYAMRLADMTMVGCSITDEHGAETLRAFNVQPGELWLCDRGYCNPEDIDWVVKAGGDVLVRLNRGSLPLYDERGAPVDVTDLMRRLEAAGETAEWPVEVHPKGRQPIRGRLCAVRLPEEEAEKARQRLRREYGRSVSRDALAAASWVVVFTTVPRERMTTQQVLQLYRLRWQMELEIKREKTIGGVDKLPNFLPETIATWLYAKLLIHQIARKIVSPAVAFPPSAIGTAALALSHPSPRDPAPPRTQSRRRDVARDGPRVPSHPRRTAPPRAA